MLLFVSNNRSLHFFVKFLSLSYLFLIIPTTCFGIFLLKIFKFGIPVSNYKQQTLLACSLGFKLNLIIKISSSSVSMVGPYTWIIVILKGYPWNLISNTLKVSQLFLDSMLGVEALNINHCIIKHFISSVHLFFLIKIQEYDIAFRWQHIPIIYIQHFSVLLLSNIDSCKLYLCNWVDLQALWDLPENIYFGHTFLEFFTRSCQEHSPPQHNLGRMHSKDICLKGLQ